MALLFFAGVPYNSLNTLNPSFNGVMPYWQHFRHLLPLVFMTFWFGNAQTADTLGCQVLLAILLELASSLRTKGHEELWLVAALSTSSQK